MLPKQQTHIYTLVFGMVVLMIGSLKAQVLDASIDSSVYRHSFSFTTENDAYLFQLKDGYYTNGLFFNWQKVHNKQSQAVISELTVSQKIFTPQGRKYFRLNGIDRPFCGLLMATFGKKYLIKPTTTTQWQASLGVVGPISLGQWVQTQYHDLLGFQEFKGWENQINNGVGLNVMGGIQQTIIKTPNPGIMCVADIQAQIGTLNTDAHAGMYMCVGKTNNLSSSVLTGNNVAASITRGKQTNASEWFFCWHPQITWQAYNATAQGALFVPKSTTAVTTPINTWMYQQNWLLVYAHKKWWISMAVTYQSREVSTQALPQRYASISIGKLY